MSNDLMLYSQDVPAYLKEAGYVDEGLSAGIAARAPKLAISLDKTFAIVEGGITTPIIGADGFPVRNFIGVILAASDTLTKAWYEKAFVPGSTEAPDCFSNDGKVPAPGVAKPQASNCATCPKNAFGSHPVTGRGKACSDRKMIVLVWQHAPDKLMTFNVPTMSLQALAKLNNDLKTANIALQSVAVQFTFDVSKQYPVVNIGTLGFVSKDMFLKFRAMADTDEVRSLLREVDYEPGADTQAAPVVPNNVIGFGTASEPKTEAPDPAIEAARVAADAKAAKLAKAKADYEAAMKAAEGEDDETNTTVVSGPASNTAPVVETPEPAATGRKRRTKAEMEAARAAEAGQAQSAPTVGQVESAIGDAANQTEMPLTTTETVATGVSSAGAPDILGLLSKWKTT